MADVVENSDMSLIQTIPALPAGKSRHFFVSYSCEERDKVIKYIDELERRFPVRCSYSDRDFQPGKDIVLNIKEGIAMSIKVLLFVSPSFLQSRWCKYETDAAFVESMGSGYSCIVPVLLEECEIPPTLTTLTYIDARIPGIDIPAKIASSLIRPNTDDGILGLNMHSWNKISENGYSFVINAEREPLLSVRPAKYMFTLKQSVFDSMELYKLPVPRRLLKKAFRVLKDDKAKVMEHFDCRNAWKICFWLILIMVPTILIALQLFNNSVELVYANRNSTDRHIYEKVMYHWDDSPILLVLMFYVAISFAILIPIYERLKKWDISLQTNLWKSVGEQCIENNILLLFSSRQRNKPPTLKVMRYNISRCKEYLVGVIQSKNMSCINDDMTAEKYADNLVKDYLTKVTTTLADDFWSLPDAPSNRHIVAGGKMCICQQLEQELR